MRHEITVNQRLIESILIGLAGFVQAITPAQTIEVFRPYVETPKVYAESSLKIVEPSLKEKAQEIAKEYGVPFEVIDSIITNESNWNPNARGGVGEIGLVQILPSAHPEITEEQMLDPEFSIRFLASEIKAGREWKWSICNCVSYLRIKGIDLPRVGDMKNLVTNSNIPRVGWVVKIVYPNSTAHGALVESVTQEGIWISQYNKPRCQFSREFIRFDSGLIEGYWYEEA